MNDGTSTSTPPDGGREPAPERSLLDVPNVRFTLPAIPANVALVRQALAGFADELGVDPARAADMKIALTEACTNAVVHAYGDGDGPLEVTMSVDHGRLILSVRDRGHGLRPLPSESEGPPLGFGLALIASLSDEFGIAGGHHGTEVRLAFSLDGAEESPPLIVQLTPGEAPAADEVVLALTPGDQAASVLGRVVSLVAARADFSIDRLSDAQIVSDAIAGSAANHTPDGYLRVGIEEREGGFELLIGPLVRGGGESLIRDTELPGLGRLLERLSDELSVEPLGDDDSDGGGSELLRARLGERVG